jgi:3,4-dihydroxy 2-butanone 4-phosphate synthase/GTP cyclohydrolase II
MEEAIRFHTIEEAIRDLHDGKMIIVVDDEDRENEGDLTMAAEKVTPEAINFMASKGRGLICVAVTGQRLNGSGCNGNRQPHRTKQLFASPSMRSAK